MAPQTPIQGSSSTDAPARVPNPQQMQAQAGARLDMFLSDGTPNPFYNRHAASGNDANRREHKVTAAIDHVDRAFAGTSGHNAGGGAGASAACSVSVTNLQGIGTRFHVMITEIVGWAWVNGRGIPEGKTNGTGNLRMRRDDFTRGFSFSDVASLAPYVFVN